MLTLTEIMTISECYPGREHFARAVIAAHEAKLREQNQPIELIWPDYHHEGMGCGLEDRGITDRYQAMEYGWTHAIEAMQERLPEELFEHPAPIQVTCQIYGHVVGACSECNTHAENDVNETNKVLADNYLKLTCGNPAPIPNSMTVLDLSDDDGLRFVQRVLESDAPQADIDAARELVVAIRTRVRKAAPIPEGWQLVPVEPSRDMLDAAHIDLDREAQIDVMLKYVWKQMLAAARSGE